MLVGPQRAVIQRQCLRLVLERILGVGERGHARNERHALLLRQLRDQLVDLLDVQNLSLIHIFIGQTRLRRVRNTLPALHMDLALTKISRLALYQPPELRHKILPRCSDDQGRTVADGNSGGNQL